MTTSRLRMMPLRAARMALLISTIVVGTSSSLAFSVVPGTETNPVGMRPPLIPQPEREHHSLVVTRRESIIGSIVGSAVIILGGSSAAFAANADECQTDCMYKCTADNSNSRKNRGKKAQKKMEISCREHQCKDHQQCKDPPSEGKSEPRLLQAQDIKGLYPRWQDDSF